MKKMQYEKSRMTTETKTIGRFQETQNETKVFRSSLSEIMVLKEDESIIGQAKSDLKDPPNPEEKSKILAKINRRKTKLLELIKREKTEKNSLSNEELNFAIESCNCQSPYTPTQRRKLTRLAWRLLGFYVEKGWKLPEEAIETLQQEYKKKDRKSYQEVLFVLSHLVNNGQINTILIELLRKELNDLILRISNQEIYDTDPSLVPLAKDLHLLIPTIILGLSALAKQNENLTNIELEFMKNSLHLIDAKEKHPFFHGLIKPKIFATNDQMHFFRPPFIELNNIKQLSRSGTSFSEKEFKYFFRYTKKDMTFIDDERLKGRVMKILRYTIFNGQTMEKYQDKSHELIEEQTNESRADKITSILIESVEKETEFNFNDKIKNNSRVAALYWVYSQPQKNQDLIEALNRDLDKQRENILRGLNYFLRKKCNRTQLPENFSDVLIKLESYPETDDKVRQRAQVALYYINKKFDTESLKELLKNPICHFEISEIILTQTKNGIAITSEVINELKVLFSKDHWCSEEARYNLLRALKYHLRQGFKDISSELITQLIQYALESATLPMQKVILGILGYYIKTTKNNIYSKEMVAFLQFSLVQENLIEDVAFTFNEIVTSYNNCPKDIEEYFELFNKISLALSSVKYTPVIKQQMALIFPQAARQGFYFSQETLKQFEELLYISDDQKVKAIIVETYYYLLQEKTQKEYSKTLPSSLIKTILKTQVQELRNEAAIVLCDYIAQLKIENNKLSNIFIEEIKILSIFPKIFCNVLNELVKKKLEMSDSLVISGLELILSEKDYEIQYNIVQSLKHIIDQQIGNKQKIRGNILVKIQKILLQKNIEKEYEISSLLVSMLCKGFNDSKCEVKVIEPALIEQLIDIICNNRIDFSVRKDSVTILSVFSKDKKQSFISKEHKIKQLIDLLNNNRQLDITLKKEIFSIFDSQMKYFLVTEKYSEIKESNHCLNNTMQSFVNYLEKKEIVNLQTNLVLLTKILQLLQNASRFKYIFNSSTLEFLISLARTHEDQNIRNFAFSIVKKINIEMSIESENIKKKLKMLCELEQCGSQVLKLEEKNAQEDCLLILYNFSRQRILLTNNNISTLLFLLKTNQAVTLVIKIIKQVVINRQILPVNFLPVLLSQLKSDENNTEELISLIEEALESGDYSNYFPEEILDFCELLIQRRKIATGSLISILLYLSQKGKLLQNKTIEKLLFSFLNYNQNEQIKLARILYLNIQQLQPLSKNVLSHFILLLKENNQDEVHEILSESLSISNIDENLVLDEMEIHNINSILEKNIDISNSQLVVFFDKLNTSKKLPENTLNLIKNKKDLIFINSNASIKERVERLHKLKNVPNIILCVLKAIETLLEQVNDDDLRKILEVVLVLQDRHKFSNVFLEKLVKTYAQQQKNIIVISEYFLKVFKNKLINNQEFSDSLIDSLLNLIASDKGTSIRKTSLYILDELLKDKKLNEKQLKVVLLEKETQSILDIINKNNNGKEEKNIFKQFLSNFKNLIDKKKFITLFKNSDVYSADTINLFNYFFKEKNIKFLEDGLQALKEKKEITYSCNSLLLDSIIKLFDHTKINQNIVAEVCELIALNVKITSESRQLAIEKAISLLEINFHKKNISSIQIKFLTKLIKNSGVYRNPQFLPDIIKAIFQNNDLIWQNSVLDLMIQMLNYSENISEEYYGHFKKLMDFFHQNNGTCQFHRKKLYQLFQSLVLKNEKIITNLVEYYSSIKSDLKKALGQSLYIKAKRIISDIQDKKERLYIFLYLLSEKIDESFLENITSSRKSLARTLLCNTLIKSTLKNKNHSFFEEKEFNDKLNFIEEVKKYHEKPYSRDRLLFKLIDLQNNTNFTLKELANILEIMAYMTDDPVVLLNGGTKNLKFRFVLDLISKLNDWELQKQEKIGKKIYQLIEKLEWDAKTIDVFFKKIHSDEKLDEVVTILELLDKEPVRTEEKEWISNKDKIYVKKWKSAIVKNLLSGLIDSDLLKSTKLINKDDVIESIVRASLIRILHQLIEKGWDFERLYYLIAKLKSNNLVDFYESLHNIYYIFNQVFIYKIPEKIFYEQETNFTFENIELVFKKLSEEAIRLHFPNLQKSNHENERGLITEMQKANQKNKNLSIINSLQENNFEAILINIDKFYNSEKLNNLLPIKDWDKTAIQTWANNIKNKKIPIHSILIQALAVMVRACELAFPHKPRNTQWLAVLSLFFKEKDQGRFAEFATGEGKTLCIVLFAILKVLQGETVDIATSSPILAKENSDQYEKLYAYFNIKVANNTDEQYVIGPKKCYGKDISVVYGSISNFEFDILHHEFDLLNTRGDRKFDNIIIDEVDNVLIDESSRIAMLSTPMPGMNFLQPLLVAIWAKLEEIWLSFYFDNDDKCFYKSEKQDQPDEPICLEKFDLRDFFYKKLEIYIDSILNNKDDTFYSKVPTHLKTFVAKQKLKWIDNALLASLGHEKENSYTIKHGEQGQALIVPVDVENTGVTQNGSTWGDGLQQFLQMKHGLALSSENITTNYLSNRAFIKRYKKSNVYGLTGTLGSQASKELLSSTYSVDFVNVPTYKEKQFSELQGIIANSREQWLYELTRTAMQEAKKGRAVLIIAKTREEANHIHNELAKNFQGTLRHYFDSDTDQALFLKNSIESNTIIVATNLAGRGTDIELSPSVRAKGGLHVCFSFMPSNLRVELQGFGRAARKGEPGSGQLILCSEDNESNINTIDDLKQERDKIEIKQLDISQEELEETKNRDKLYSCFVNLLKKIKEKEKNSIYLKSKGDVLNHRMKESYEKRRREAIEERWGLWCKENDLDFKNWPLLDEQFTNFENTILNDYDTDTVVKNPFYHIKFANDVMQYANNWQSVGLRPSLYQLAIDYFDRAIQLDPIYAYMAYYNRACARLILKEPKDYKVQAKADLQKSLELIEKYIYPQINAMSETARELKQLDNSGIDSAFSVQLRHKLQVLNYLQDSIKNALKKIEASQRLINITVIANKQKEYFYKLNQAQALEILEKHSNETSQFQIDFCSLTPFSDSLAGSQSINTTKKAWKVKPGYTALLFNIDNLQDQREGKELLKCCLPISKEKEYIENITNKIIEKNEKNNSKNSANDEDESLTSTEVIGKKLKKKAAFVGDVFIKIKDGFSNQVQKSKSKYSNWKYKEIKKIPVSLHVKNVSVAHANEFIKDLINLSIVCKNAKVTKKVSEKSIKLTVISILENPIKKASFVLKGADKSLTDFLLSNFNDKILLTEMLEKENKSNVTFAPMALKEIKKFLENFSENQTPPFNITSSINIDFILPNLEQHDTEALIERFPLDMTLCFENLSHVQSKKLLELTEDDKFTQARVLRVANLKKDEAKNLISEADREEWHFNTNLKSIESEFINKAYSETELQEYRDHGFSYLFTIDEKKAIPWRSIALVTALGIVQIAGGLALTACTLGFGANFGLGLTTEGVGDILRGVMAGFTHTLSWTDYAVQKSISLAISLLTAGWCTIAGKLSKVTGDSVDEVVTIGLAAKQALKERFILGGRKLMTNSIKLTSKNLTHFGLGKIKESIIKNAVEPEIRGAIRMQVAAFFSDKIMKKTFIRACMIDSILNSKESYLSNLKINIKQKFIDHQKGVVFEQKANVYQDLELFEKAMPEIMQNVQRSLPSFSKVLEKKLGISENDATNLVIRLKDHTLGGLKFLTKDDRINLQVIQNYAVFNEDNGDIENLAYHARTNPNFINRNILKLGVFDNRKDEIIELCIAWASEGYDDFTSERNQLINDMSEFLKDRVMRPIHKAANAIQNQLTSVISLGINKSVNKLESQIFDQNITSTSCNNENNNEDKVSENSDNTVDNTLKNTETGYLTGRDDIQDTFDVSSILEITSNCITVSGEILSSISLQDIEFKILSIEFIMLQRLFESEYKIKIQDDKDRQKTLQYNNIESRLLNEEKIKEIEKQIFLKEKEILEKFMSKIDEPISENHTSKNTIIILKQQIEFYKQIQSHIPNGSDNLKKILMNFLEKYENNLRHVPNIESQFKELRMFLEHKEQTIKPLIDLEKEHDNLQQIQKALLKGHLIEGVFPTNLNQLKERDNMFDSNNINKNLNNSNEPSKDIVKDESSLQTGLKDKDSTYEKGMEITQKVMGGLELLKDVGSIIKDVYVVKKTLEVKKVDLDIITKTGVNIEKNKIATIEINENSQKHEINKINIQAEENEKSRRHEKKNAVDKVNNKIYFLDKSLNEETIKLKIADVKEDIKYDKGLRGKYFERQLDCDEGSNKYKLLGIEIEKIDERIELNGKTLKTLQENLDNSLKQAITKNENKKEKREEQINENKNEKLEEQIKISANRYSSFQSRNINNNNNPSNDDEEKNENVNQNQKK